MGFLLAFIYTVLFIFLIYRLSFFKIKSLKPTVITGVFLLKILFGFLLWGVYTYYYEYRNTGDSFKYFDDAAFIYNAIFINPLDYLQMITGIYGDNQNLMIYYEQMNHWFKEYDYGIYNDNRTIIRINALIYIFSSGHYPVHIVFWCFISLTGLTAIFKLLHPVLKDKTRELIFAVFLLPSVLFWGSGVLKEGILLFAFGMLLYHFHGLLFKKFSLLSLVWAICSIMLLVLIKGYVLLALIPGLASLLLIKITGANNSGLKFIFTHLVLLIISINLFHIDKELDVLYYLYQKQKDFITVSELMQAESFIKTNIFEPHWSSLFLNFPEALFNVLARPFISESSNVFIFAAAFENLLLMVIALMSLLFYSKPRKEQLPLLFFSIFFVISLAGIIGFVTPVIGAIVRYKIPLLPFFLFIFIIIADKEKMIQKISFLKFLK